MKPQNDTFSNHVNMIKFEELKNDKILIFSDIHSNIKAYDLLIKYANEHNIKKMICLGDIVGKNFPDINNQLLDKIRKEKRIVAIVRGNWDSCVADDFDPAFMGLSRAEEAKSKSEFLRKFISRENLDWISKLKERGNYQNFGLTHVPGKISIYKTIDAIKLEDTMTKYRINFFGHTHEQAVFEKKDKDSFKSISFSCIYLKSRCKYFINPGSIGENGRFGILNGNNYSAMNIYAAFN